jgi:hypothetical protein
MSCLHWLSAMFCIEFFLRSSAFLLRIHKLLTYGFLSFILRSSKYLELNWNSFFQSLLLSGYYQNFRFLPHFIWTWRIFVYFLFWLLFIVPQRKSCFSPSSLQWFCACGLNSIIRQFLLFYDFNFASNFCHSNWRSRYLHLIYKVSYLADL